MRRRIMPVLAGLAILSVFGCVGAEDREARGGPIRDLITGRNGNQGAPEASVGLDLRTLTFQGLDRAYYVHVPPGGGAGRPAVLMFHGGEGDGTGAEATSRMAEAADEAGFVAIFPNSAEGQWNDGRATTAGGPDDVAFVRAVIQDSAARDGIDPGRVFAAGMSNGGMFTQRLACDLPGTFQAFAVAAANLPADLQGRCSPGRSAAMVFFSGTDDPIMPFGGGEIGTARRIGVGVGGAVLSFPETEAFWSRVNGCLSDPRSQPLPDVSDDGTRVVRMTSAGCTGGGEVESFVIEGGGHAWPGSTVRRARFAGTTSQDVDATRESVAFFRRHGL